MKKAIGFVFVSIVMCLQLVLPSQAISIKQESVVVSETVEQLADGTKIVTVIEKELPPATAFSSTYTLTGSKTRKSLNANDEILWTFTTKGTFSVVDGVSSTCTAASYSYTAPASGWSLKSGSATKSSNKAIGHGVFEHKFLGITLDTVEVNCTLTCSTTGVLS